MAHLVLDVVASSMAVRISTEVKLKVACGSAKALSPEGPKIMPL